MIRYKADVFQEMKAHGFNQTRLRAENLLSQQTITNIKAGKGNITLETLNKICLMCHCQPGDIIEVVKAPGEEKYIC